MCVDFELLMRPLSFMYGSFRMDNCPKERSSGQKSGQHIIDLYDDQSSWAVNR